MPLAVVPMIIQAKIIVLTLILTTKIEECNDNKRKAGMNEHHGDWYLASNKAGKYHKKAREFLGL